MTRCRPYFSSVPCQVARILWWFLSAIPCPRPSWIWDQSKTPYSTRGEEVRSRHKSYTCSITENQGRPQVNSSKGKGWGRSKSRGRSQDWDKSRDGINPHKGTIKCYHRGIEGHIKKVCWKLQNEQGQGNQQRKNEDGDTLVIISHEIAILSVGEEECLHVADHDAEWVVETTAFYHATPI